MKRKDDFEKQLMKDNLTIKEQIANLQKTISRLKNDMIVSEKNENKHISANKLFKEDNNCDLKFSFNQAKKIRESKEEVAQPAKKKNFYIENMNKIRKEKQILSEMNNFKKENRQSDIKYQIESPPKKEIKINLDSVSDSEQIDKIISQSKNQHNKFNSYQNYVNQNEDKVSFDLNITTTINNNSKNVIKRSITPTKRKKRNVSFDTTSNEIKSYLTEISNLKREISKLEKENNKLYKDLQTEREQNKKYRTLTEDIIKQFQKSKRTQLKK